MRKAVGIALSVFWISTVSYGVTMMHSWHNSDLSPRSKVEIEEVRFGLSTQSYGVIHFITPMCGCSREVFKHLMKEGPLDQKNYNEQVIVIDDFKDGVTKELEERGFNVSRLNTKEAERFFGGEVRGVPLLTIFDRSYKTKYVGGYTEKSITPFTKINYKKFLEKIERNKKVVSLPVIGCAVSKQYQKLLDPFGLKYGEVL